MDDKKFLVSIFSLTLLVFGLGIFLVYKLNVPSVLPSQGAKIEVLETSFDWGEVKIEAGNVEKEFEIKNSGSEELILFDIKTSCMCTTAQLISDEAFSPVFGMHEKSSYKMGVAPGEKVRLKIVFDPAYHGPTGIGPVTRQVSLGTNDPENPLLSFMLTAMVTR